MCVTNSAATRSGGRQSCSGMYPTRPRTVSPSFAGSIPRTRTPPVVGAISPSRILMSVDLPAPFAPTSPTIPGSTSTVSASRAVTRGYLLVNADISISATHRLYVSMLRKRIRDRPLRGEPQQPVDQMVELAVEVGPGVSTPVSFVVAIRFLLHLLQL